MCVSILYIYNKNIKKQWDMQLYIHSRPLKNQVILVHVRAILGQNRYFQVRTGKNYLLYLNRENNYLIVFIKTLENQSSFSNCNRLEEFSLIYYGFWT